MAPLKFVVEPRLKPVTERIGSEESGIFEIERRGYLSAGERNFVQQFQQNDTGSVGLITLARKVAKQFSINVTDAYNAITAVIGGTEAEDQDLVDRVEASYSEEIQKALSDLSTTQARLEIVQAMCLLTNRIDDNIKMEQVIKLHPDIITGLAELYRDEEMKSLEKLKNNEDSPPEEQEETKKPSKTKTDG